MKRVFVGTGVAVALATIGTAAYAQAAGGGADFNRWDRTRMERMKESERLRRVDPPLRPDPLGNALIGGAVTGSMRGAAAGAASVARGGAAGVGLEKGKESYYRYRDKNNATYNPPGRSSNK